MNVESSQRDKFTITNTQKSGALWFPDFYRIRTPIPTLTYIRDLGGGYVTKTGERITYSELAARQRDAEQFLANAINNYRNGGEPTNQSIIKYYSNYPESLSIKEQIRLHQDKLSSLAPVSAYKSNLLSTDKKGSILDRMFPEDQTEIITEREGYGKIIIKKGDIKKGFKYLDNDAEFAAVQAVPDVIKSGIEIHNKDNHKDRGYHTVTIAAPVSINGARGNMAVVLKQTDRYKYHVHRILTPEGKTLEIPDKKTTAVTTPGRSTETLTVARPSLLLMIIVYHNRTHLSSVFRALTVQIKLQLRISSVGSVIGRTIRKTQARS